MTELIQAAIEAQKYSYSPYSNFQVGAALLTKGDKIYTGCNIENASYTPTCCAERTAFSKAVSEGELEFKAIAIVGNPKDKEEAREYCAPCGVCRQVMAEFCNLETFKIIVAKSEDDYKEYTLAELLPLAFTKDSL